MKSDFPNSPDRIPDPRIFTLAEANAMVPIFTEMMAEINSLKTSVVMVMESKSEVSKSNGHIHHDSPESHHDMELVSVAAGRITELVDQINRSGAELKDLDMGLVDFPHQREGRIVYLCWMYGEEEIGFWHELDSGAAGRKPL